MLSPSDVIAELGELAFASRLKRLAERLQREVTLLYQKLEIPFEAKWFTVIYLLYHRAPLTITAIAQAIGLTHTAINQLARELVQQGFVSSARGLEDERERRLVLTPKGQAIFQQLAPVLEVIREETQALIATSGCDFLQGLQKIEHALSEQDMFTRVWYRLKGELPGEIEICEYQSTLKKYFKSLNYEWLQEYFTIEPGDEKILADPRRKIIQKGGAVFFARLNNEIVGTGALMKHRGDYFELVKMAVTKKYQRRGVGPKILQATLEYARNRGFRELYLLTNENLTAAIQLYKKFGFERTDEIPFKTPQYQRETFGMIKIL